MPFYTLEPKQTTFASTLTLAVDLTNATGLLVQVFTQGVLTAGGTPINSVVIDPTGANITMLAFAEDASPFTGSNAGKFRTFYYFGSLPAGVKNILVTMADGNGKPNAWALPFSGFTAIAQKARVTGGGSTATTSLASTLGETMLTLLCETGDPATITPTAPTAKIATVVATDGGGTMALKGAVLTNEGTGGTVSPTAVGSSTYGSWALLPFALTPLVTALVFTGTVPAQNGTVGTASSALALASYFSGGTAPYSYSISAGSLPPGLSLHASTGQITGTPTTAGSYSATVRVTDSAGTPATADSNSIAFTVAAAPATATTLSGPTGGQSGQASAPFLVGANGVITGTITVTPSDGGAGGTFTPTSVNISAGTPTAAFTYTPASVGAKTISLSDTGGLTDATALIYTSTSTPGTITVPGLKAWTGTAQIALTVPNVVVIELATRSLVLALTSQTTDSSGNLTMTSGLFVPGVGYMILGFTNDGASSFRRAVTAV